MPSDNSEGQRKAFDFINFWRVEIFLETLSTCLISHSLKRKPNNSSIKCGLKLYFEVSVNFETSRLSKISKILNSDLHRILALNFRTPKFISPLSLEYTSVPCQISRLQLNKQEHRSCPKLAVFRSIALDLSKSEKTKN